MPITTDTLWNQNRLNLAFAISGVAFLGTTIWMLVEDQFRPWKDHQAAYQADVALLAELDIERYSGADFKRQLDAATRTLARLDRNLENDGAFQRSTEDKYEAEQKLQGANLAFNDAKAVRDVRKQDYERAVLAYGENGPATQTALRILRAQSDVVDQTAATREALEDEISNLKRFMKERSKDRDAAQKTLAALARKRDSALARLALNDDSVTNMIRNTALDFAVGTIKVKGGIVPLVDDQFNFLRQPRVDRCQTCHIAIDDKRFTEEELTVSLALNLEAVNSQRREDGYRPADANIEVRTGQTAERDFVLAPARGAAAGASAPVSMVTYHPAPASSAIGGEAGRGNDMGGSILGRVGALADGADHAGMAPDADRTQTPPENGHSADESSPLARVRVRLEQGGKLVKETRTNSQGRYEFRDVPAGAYHVRVQQFEEIPLPFRLPDAVPDPAPARVDAEGHSLSEQAYAAAVEARDAAYLDRLSRLDADRERYIRGLWDRLGLAGERERQSQIFEAVVQAANDYRASQGRVKLNLDHPLKAHPNLDLYVGPDSKHPMKQMGCTVCHGGNGDETSFTTASHTASSPEQEEHWIEKYEGRIDYRMAQHWWNHPMLQAKYVEASCLQCHTGAADVAQNENRPLATRIVKGRQLFTQVGCINCHKVEDLDQSRKVGPDLSHIAQKLKPEFVQQWIWYPREFRPSTWMPHFFKQENNYAKSDLPNDPDPDPKLRTQTEVAAMASWLFTFSTPYETEPLPDGLTSDIESGRKLFDTLGCLACHGALNHRRQADGQTLGVQWISADLAYREKLDATHAVARARGMTYAEQSRYAMKHLTQARRDRMQLKKQRLLRELNAARVDQDTARTSELQKQLDAVFVPAAFTRFAPELSGVGSKVSVAWLYNWIRNPRHYHSYTKMPRLRLSEQEALDVASYLKTLKNEGFDQHVFEINDERAAMRDKLILELLEGQNSKARAEAILKSADATTSGPSTTVTLSAMIKQLVKHVPDRAAAEAAIDQLDGDGRRLLFLGGKMINHYGCASCHAIPGFEKTTRPGTELTEWSEKPLNKLDLAFFEHVFHDKRGEEFEHLYPQSDTFTHLRRDGGQQDIHPIDSHASFAWHKVKNPRVWDRGKVKSAYEKLKMPNFFFTDDEADALTTYLRSRQETLVSDQLIPSAETGLPAVAAGRNLVAELNCVGCHKIEGNSANMHQFILAGEFEAATSGADTGGGGGDEDEAWDEEGDADSQPTGSKPAPQEEDDEWGDEGDAAPTGGESAPQSAEDDGSSAVIAAGSGGEYDQVNGPPWLRGEGAKAQPAWLDDFLHNVEPLRPWLRVRMPSFNLTNEQSTTLVEYFAAVSQRESEMLRRHLAPVRKYMDKAMTDSLANGDKPGEGRVPGDQWFRQPQLESSARFLSRYSIENDLQKPLDFHGDPASAALAQSYLEAVRRAGFVEELLDAPYPFGAGARDAVSPQRFDLGREMAIDVLDCLACHALGDPNVPGAKQNPSAPNLSLAYRRLRRDWIDKWLQEPAFIQPGTKMPQWFAGGKSAFVDFGDERTKFEQEFGPTGQDQRELLLDFLHEAGARGYTGIKGGPAAPAAPSASDKAGDKKQIED